MEIIKAFERIEEMDREYIAAIKDKLSTQLPKKRYEHSVGVSYISSALAMRYGADIYKEAYEPEKRKIKLPKAKA